MPEHKDLDYRHIVVTGGSGQIGTSFLNSIKQVDVEVSIIDLYPPAISSPNFNFLRCDLKQNSGIAEIKNKIKSADALVHLASRIKDFNDVIEYAIPSIDLNVRGMLNLLQYLPSLKMICFTSSYMVYGDADPTPVSEKHPTNPKNIYGASKLAAEKYLKVFSRRFNVPVTILRLMGVYGPGTPISSHRAIPSFIRSVYSNSPPIIYGTGMERRNYLYIDDAVDAILQSLNQGTNNVYNIGGTQALSTREIAETIIEISGKDLAVRYQKNGGKDFIIDTSKAKKEMGFVPKTSLKEGLEKEIADHKELGEI